METILLQTKLYIPPTHPGLVPRPDLIKRLKVGLDRKLTLISAPAGFGKTTLVSDLIRQSEGHAAWLTLDEYDNDPTRFFTYFVAALQTVKRNLGTTVLALLENQPSPPLETLLTALINEITTLPTPRLLVLDDYHFIQTQAVHDLLTFLLTHMPPQLHLIIISRTDPQLPLPRLRVQGELAELRAADIAFTLAETAVFLKQATGLTVASETLKALERRTEGWAAGLQVAALSLQGRSPEESEAFLDSFTGSHRYMLDYLAEEILAQQSEEIQRFLLQTAILDQLSARLCNAVTERTDSQQILQKLEQANLFLVPLDDERQWYRYHHLFADFLRSSLSASAQHDQTLLHRRAAAWQQQHGFPHQAIKHLLAAADLDGAARLIGQVGTKMLTRGESATVEKWLDRLPANTVYSHPQIGLIRAWALLSKGQYQAVQKIIPIIKTAVSHQLVDSSSGNSQDWLGQVAAIQATIAANLRHISETISYSHQALNQLNEANKAVNCIVRWNLAFAYRLQGDLAAAKEMYEEAITTSQDVRNHFITIQATTGLANVQRFQGNLSQAHQTYLDALAYADRNQGSVYHALDTYMYLAGLQYEWNQLAAATKNIEQGISLSQEIGYKDALAMFYGQLALVQQAQGQLDHALKTIELANGLVQRHQFLRRVPAIALIQARLYIQQGQIAAAARLAQVHHLPSITIRIHIARKQIQSALDLLAERQCDLPEQKGDRAHLIMFLLLEAQAYQIAGNESSALNTMKEALILAEPGGYIRNFVDEGEWIADLLRETAVRDLAPGYVRKLLVAFANKGQDSSELGETVHTLSPLSQPTFPLVEPLSKRELDTLGYLATPLSIPEIAAEMMIAVSTVRSHVKRIYGKLQVHSRREAVHQAEVMGLLRNN